MLGNCLKLNYLKITFHFGGHFVNLLGMPSVNFIKAIDKTVEQYGRYMIILVMGILSEAGEKWQILCSVRKSLESFLERE